MQEKDVPELGYIENPLEVMYEIAGTENFISLRVFGSVPELNA